MTTRQFAGMAIVTMLAGCQQPARGVSYFEAHLEEARAVVDQCRAGTKRDDECGTAEQVVRRQDHADQLKRELGDVKREPDKSLHF